MKTTPKFREDKTTQAASLLIELSGGEIYYMKLIKLLYLVDREALIRWGKPITFDLYFSMDYGPILSQTLDLIAEGVKPGRDSLWLEHISGPSGYNVKLKRRAGREKLSQAEIDLVGSIFERYGHIVEWDLVALLHKELPEWQNPKGSRIPIHYEDILKAVGKDEAEIKAVQDELDFHSYVDESFSRQAV